MIRCRRDVEIYLSRPILAQQTIALSVVEGNFCTLDKQTTME
jgi:hypothetical protein